MLGAQRVRRRALPLCLERRPANPVALLDGRVDGLGGVAVFLADERGHLAGRLRASSAADAVKVVNAVAGKVVEDHVIDCCCVEAARGNVGADEDVDVALAELLVARGALLKVNVAVKR